MVALHLHSAFFPTIVKVMAQSGTLDGPAIGGFSNGDISLTAPYAPLEAPRPRASTSSSRRPRRQVTPIIDSHTQSVESQQTLDNNELEEQQDAEADLLTKATQPVTGLRMR